MSIINLIKGKIDREKGKFRLNQQVNERIKADKLEIEAEYSKQIKTSLERQNKANKIIKATNELKSKQRKEKIKAVLEPFKQFQAEVKGLQSKPQKSKSKAKSSLYNTKVKNVWNWNNV